MDCAEAVKTLPEESNTRVTSVRQAQELSRLPEERRAEVVEAAAATARVCVELALKEFPKLSSKAISEMCGVSHPFVLSLRPQDVTVTSSKVQGSDGKTYPAKKPHPGNLLGREVALGAIKRPA